MGLVLLDGDEFELELDTVSNVSGYVRWDRAYVYEADEHMQWCEHPRYHSVQKGV